MDDVLLVTIDSLRADHVGHLGYDRETTPNIDALAEAGTYCTNAYAHACSTRPSFPSILTSAYATMYGGFERIADEQTTVAERFDDAGYQTAGFHSNLYLSTDFGYGRGFDAFYDSKTDPDLLSRLRVYLKNSLDADSRLYRTLQYFYDKTEEQAGIDIGQTYTEAAEITARATSWLNGLEADSNVFLWVHYMDVHHPYVPREEEYSELELGSPPSGRRAIKLRRKMLEQPGEITEDERQTLIDLYDAEVRYTDRHIGQLISSFREKDSDQTVLITSDHGEEFKDHGRFSHHATFYDEVVRVPFVLAPHGDGTVCEDLVGLLDVSPTVVDAAGLNRPNSWQGESLPEMLAAEEWPREQIIGDWQTGDPGEKRFSVRDHDWKFISNADGQQLYHLLDDPNETENVAEDHPDVVAEMEAVVDAHREEVEATNVELGEVEMEEGVKQRLRDLGYKE